jgi:SAM-dependent methyltransferase
MPLTDWGLRLGFRLRGPWTTRFVIGRRAYGGRFDALTDARVDWFFEAFPGVATILELGSLEGGHTFALAARPGVRRVLGLEGRAANVRRARYVQKLLRVENVAFAQADLETTPLAPFGDFDAVFCCGLLYHLPRPWELVGEMARVAPRLFLSTHVAPADRPRVWRGGYEGSPYPELGLKDPLSGLSPESFWPTREELERMLRDHGYRTITAVCDHPDHPHGPAITLTAAA